MYGINSHHWRVKVLARYEANNILACITHTNEITGITFETDVLQW